jgi:hypothetical protein
MWVFLQGIAPTMQHLVLMVDELEKFPAAKQHLFVELLRDWAIGDSHC